jgi:hypothetical protein
VEGAGNVSLESRNRSSINQLKNPKSEAAEGTKKKKKTRRNNNITVKTIQMQNKTE